MVRILKDTDPVYIFAGNMAQAKNWMREKVRFLDSKVKIMGLTDFSVVNYGTNYERDDYLEVVDEIKAREIQSKVSSKTPTNNRSDEKCPDCDDSVVLEVDVMPVIQCQKCKLMWSGKLRTCG